MGKLSASNCLLGQQKCESYPMTMYLKRLILAAIFSALVLEAHLSSGQETNAPYDGSWESLQTMPVPAWFDDGKIGIFIHWGPYSAIGYRKNNRGYSEHVPKMMYRDPDHYFPVIEERWGAHPPEFGYKDIIPEFRAENWEPDAWAELFDEVGAKYVVMTAEHHDGWANWDSDLTPWNAVDKGPKRDLVGDLGVALRKRGLKYAPSYHRERHQSFFAKKLYVVDAKPLPAILEEIKRMPESESLYGPFGTTREFVDDYVARWKEIQDKYQPDMLWMDDFPIYTRDGNNVRKGKAKPQIQYFDDQVRAMITEFMNDGAARGADVYVNNKGGNRNWPDGVGCLEKDNLKLKQIGPKWQSCTTFGTSFGYLEGDKYKTVESVIHEMVEVISRNGNFLINIGPKSDGTLVPEQVERLRAMGQWLKINGDAIYGSRYWQVNEQADERLAFTTNGKKLYAIKLTQPNERFKIDATEGWDASDVTTVRLLGSESSVEWSVESEGLTITPPKDLGLSQHAWTFEIVTTSDQHQPAEVLDDAKRALKGTGKVDLDGNAKPSDGRHK
jgi:alpha-L-fucosidase